MNTLEKKKKKKKKKKKWEQLKCQMLAILFDSPGY